MNRRQLTGYDYSQKNIAKMRKQWEAGKPINEIARDEGCNCSSLRYHLGISTRKKNDEMIGICTTCLVIVRKHPKCKKCKILLHDLGGEMCRCGIQHGVNHGGLCEKHV